MAAGYFNTPGAGGLGEECSQAQKKHQQHVKTHVEPLVQPHGQLEVPRLL